MNQSPEPNPPIAPVVAELVAPPPAKPVDPIIEIQQLREQQRRWKGRFIAVCVAFVFLLVVSVLQFVGTFITCQVLYAARRDSEHAQRQTSELLKDMAEARNSMIQAAQNLLDARQTLAKLKSLDQQLQSMEKRIEIPVGTEETRLAALFAEQEQKLRDIDAMLERVRRINKAAPEPFQDPQDKQPSGCPVDPWPGTRGLSTAGPREETAELLPLSKVIAAQEPAEATVLRDSLKSRPEANRPGAIQALAELGPKAASGPRHKSCNKFADSMTHRCHLWKQLKYGNILLVSHTLSLSRLCCKTYGGGH